MDPWLDNRVMYAVARYVLREYGEEGYSILFLGTDSSSYDFEVWNRNDSSRFIVRCDKWGNVKNLDW